MTGQVNRFRFSVTVSHISFGDSSESVILRLYCVDLMMCCSRTRLYLLMIYSRMDTLNLSLNDQATQISAAVVRVVIQ